MTPGSIEDDGLRVAIPQRPWALPLGVAAALTLGGVTFWQLSLGRERIEQARLTDPAPESRPIIGLDDVPPPPEPQPAGTAFDVAAADLPVPFVEPQPVTAEVFLPPPASSVDAAARLKSPSLVVDLSEPSAPPSAPVGPPGEGVRPGAVMQALAPGQSGGGADALNPDERFAQRAGLGGEGGAVKATAMGDLGAIVIEGTLIPAVLETAINSDLPGFARAIVSRDVLSFDGKHVLVPRGSRLIGQYRSGMALGQSRAFVIWSRLVRPDGATVSLGSPGTDELGRGGLEGKVDRHFLRRFGGAILLSLISAAASAATSGDDTQVIIASTRAGGDAAAIAIQESINVSPTIQVPQGAAIRVFVARDLDFSAVGPWPKTKAQ